MKAKFVRLRDTAIVPTKGSERAACFDLYAAEGTYIMPGQTKLISTGLSIQPPEGFCIKIYARSGIATKRGLRPANCVGICDEDYTGEYMVALHNDSPEMQTVADGERIAQISFERYYSVEFEEVEKLEETERGSGGFGSTGTN